MSYDELVRLEVFLVFLAITAAVGLIIVCFVVGIDDEKEENKEKRIMTKKEFDELKPGDKVRIVKKRVVGMNCSGKMDKWLGRVMTVSHRVNNNCIHMVEDRKENLGRGWFWREEMIEHIVSSDVQIDILKRGNKTIAKREKNIGIAERSPKDKDDEAKGVIIAVARMYGYDVVSDKDGEVTLVDEKKIVEEGERLFNIALGKAPFSAKKAKDRVKKELAEEGKE